LRNIEEARFRIRGTSNTFSGSGHCIDDLIKIFLDMQENIEMILPIFTKPACVNAAESPDWMSYSSMS
jgi:hypothetical protein